MMKNKVSNLFRISVVCLWMMVFLPCAGSSESLDFSGNGVLDLGDAVKALNVLAGDPTSDVAVDAGDRIEIGKVITILNIVANMDSYENDNTPDQATLITLGDVRQYTFHYADDEDWLKFSGEPGKVYTIEAQNMGSRRDAVIGLYDTDGTSQLKEANYQGTERDETLIWNKCEQEGIYYVKITNINSDILGEISDYALSVSVSDPITSDDAQQHDFNKANDADWVHFSGEIGKTYTIEAKNPGSRCDTVIELYNSEGIRQIKSNYRAYANDELLAWKCEQEGPYSVKLTNADPNVFGENTGYELSLSVLDTSVSLWGEENDTFEQASLILLDECQHHDFYKAGDEDWVMFYGVKDMPYTIEAVNVGSKCSLSVTLYDTDGESEIISSDYQGYGKDIKLGWKKCDNEGIYYAKATNRESDIGEGTEYDLHVFIPDGAFPRGAIVGYVGNASGYSIGTVDDVSITISEGINPSRNVYYNHSIAVFYAYGLDEGTYTLTAKAGGYVDFSIEMPVGSVTIRKDIWMMPQ